MTTTKTGRSAAQSAKLNKLIAAIEAEAKATFDMNTWFESYEGCGTSACIGGMLQLIENPRLNPDGDWSPLSMPQVGDLIGVDTEQAWRLCYAMNGFGSEDDDAGPDLTIPLGLVSKEMAIKALTKIRDGETFTTWADPEYMAMMSEAERADYDEAMEVREKGRQRRLQLRAEKAAWVEAFKAKVEAEAKAEAAKG